MAARWAGGAGGSARLGSPAMNEPPTAVRSRPGAIPGASFVDLLRRVAPAPASRAPGAAAGAAAPFEITHGTTVVAIRYADGVVMAGDRRATAGLHDRQPAHREGVRRPTTSPASRSPAPRARRSRWCKLFQVQLEHYEKIEGETLLARGQGQPARAARAGEPAGGDAGLRGRAAVRRATTTAAAAAASSATTSPAATTRRSTSRPTARAASTPATGSRPRGGRTSAATRPIDLALRALFAAADEDAATGGPDLVRGIFPTVATIDADGFRALADDDIVADARRGASSAGARRERACERCPFYVSPEQVMKDRADYAAEGHRPGPQPGRARAPPTGIVIVAENPSRTLYKISEIYDRIAFARRRQVQRVRDAARSPACARPTSRATRTHART